MYMNLHGDICEEDDTCEGTYQKGKGEDRFQGYQNIQGYSCEVEEIYDMFQGYLSLLWRYL